MRGADIPKEEFESGEMWAEEHLRREVELQDLMADLVRIAQEITWEQERGPVDHLETEMLNTKQKIVNFYRTKP